MIIGCCIPFSSGLCLYCCHSLLINLCVSFYPSFQITLHQTSFPCKLSPFNVRINGKCFSWPLPLSTRTLSHTNLVLEICGSNVNQVFLKGATCAMLSMNCSVAMIRSSENQSSPLKTGPVINTWPWSLVLSSMRPEHLCYGWGSHTLDSLSRRQADVWGSWKGGKKSCWVLQRHGGHLSWHSQFPTALLHDVLLNFLLKSSVCHNYII